MTNREKGHLAALLMVGATVAASAAWAAPRLRLAASSVSSVIYPEQEISLSFDHAAHLALGMTCLQCHELAQTSRGTADNLVPHERQCVACHGESTRRSGRGPAELVDGCRACHPAAQERVLPSSFPPAALHFSHQQHREQECSRCHSRVQVRALATVDDLPSMQVCLACHGREGQSLRCESCHLSRPGGRLRTQLEAGALQPPDWMYGAQHGLDWTENHGPVATQQQRLCRSCHEEHECLACHDGNLRPREVHPGDWQTLHSFEARGRSLRCQSCHRGQSFCRSCHLRAAVSLRTPFARRDSTAPVVHQNPQWGGGSSPLHGREARRALTTCVSCHAGQDCVSCHLTVSPHPPGFNRRCRALVRAGSQACVACHSSSDGLCD
jgi:hypothetical protein